MTMITFLFFFPTQRNDTKTSRVRTNYKLRVGEKPIGRYTGYFLSEALIFASTNPQYDDRLFIELRVQ